MPDAGAARRAAQHILAGPQFHAHPGRSFDPLGGLLNWIGRGLAFVFTPIGHFLARLVANRLVLVLLLVAMAVGAAALASLVVRRRARLGAVGAAHATADHETDDPQALERRADRAEAAGDFELAVRLRFRAGLLRLERGGLVTARETTTSTDIATTLRSPSFEHLAADLESIVYAGEDAREEQVAAARSLWPRVAEEAGRR